ncbi:MAG: LysM peptidoglycan-binding domain-containing protein [Candidatus Cryptobacteroides sp.]|nr:LysM peptidoglycan-binding domain-containing protein [Candidatus Cryptobacteroides sp.]
MYRKRLTIIFLTAAMLIAPASMHAQGTRQKLKKENQELRNEVDSLKKAMEKLRKEKLVKDSIAKEMIGIYEENEDKSAAGLNPEDYNAETTDSLLNIWYMHRQVSGNREGEGYDMDSVRFSSNVSDAVMKERLENMNSFITLPYNEKVRNFMILYSEKMPTKMGHILGLCQYYMPIFEETFNKYKLPDELKYVAIIESALNPTAVSRAGAKGMWQFMMQTAKSYGLEINSYVDERLDPFKSSDAAARYLQDSYRLFGDWNLAISSYNCGPGNVNKAIRRSGSRDFWAVYDYLPRETRGYVPAFVGAMYAIKYSKEYGLQASGVQMPAQVDTFEIHRNLHLQQVADMVGIPMSELKNLNPQYIKDIIPGNNKTYILRLPFNYSSAFIENEDSIYTYKAAELLNPQTLVKAENSDGGSSVSKPVRSSAGGNSGGTRISYKVRSGDSLGKIASRHGVTVAQLKSWNHLRSNTIKAGQRLYIYKKGSSGYSSTSSKSSSGSSSNYVTYTVRSGDTLSKIASRYGTTVSKIQKANGIGSKIRAGQKLRIPR